MSSSVHNLQKLITASPVKNNIITKNPHCPNECTYSNLNFFLLFLSIPLSHRPNNFFILAGGGILKIKYTTYQTILANGH
jgi:hypothetical protein